MSDYKEFEQKMKKTCEALSTQLATIRAGRANAAVLDQIEVDYYGSPTPIQQVASIATPDPRSLLIQPWDASVLKGKSYPRLRSRHQPPERRPHDPSRVPAADRGAP